MLDGRAGTDTIIAGAGNDTIIGGANGNFIDGGPGIDSLDYSAAPSAVGINLTTGGSSNGYGAFDFFSNIENAIGSSFDDVLVASAAINVLTGGPGNDNFMFQRGQANGDTVSDFNGNGTAAGDLSKFMGYGTAAQAQPSPRLMSPIGASTPLTASRTKSSRSRTGPLSTRVISYSCEKSKGKIPELRATARRVIFPQVALALPIYTTWHRISRRSICSWRCDYWIRSPRPPTSVG